MAAKAAMEAKIVAKTKLLMVLNFINEYDNDRNNAHEVVHLLRDAISDPRCDHVDSMFNNTVITTVEFLAMLSELYKSNIATLEGKMKRELEETHRTIDKTRLEIEQLKNKLARYDPSQNLQHEKRSVEQAATT